MRFLSSLAIGTALLGCSLARTPLGVGADAGGLDAAALDTPALDAPMIDTGMPDVPLDIGALCTDREARCEGDLVVRCADGVPSIEDCDASGAYCESGACVPRVCIPNAVTCDGAVETRCDARGATSTSSDCPRGCTAGTGCNPLTACALAVQGTVPVGSPQRLDTCGAGDNSVFNAGCTSVERSGPDVIARLEVPVRADYRIELRRLDGGSGTDPVLYVRAACADGATELACNDDAVSGIVSSRIDITLEPGDYFLMLDTFRDDGESLEAHCGRMDISVELR